MVSRAHHRMGLVEVEDGEITLQKKKIAYIYPSLVFSVKQRQKKL